MIRYPLLILTLPLILAQQKGKQVEIVSNVKNFHAFRYVSLIKAPVSYVHARMEWDLKELFHLVMVTCLCSQNLWDIQEEHRHTHNHDNWGFYRSRANKLTLQCDEVHHHITNIQKHLGLPPSDRDVKTYFREHTGEEGKIQSMYDVHSKRQVVAALTSGFAVGGVLGAIAHQLFEGRTPPSHFHHDLEELRALAVTEQNLYMVNVTISRMRKAMNEIENHLAVQQMIEHCELVAEESLRLIDKSYAVLDSLNRHQLPIEIMYHTNLSSSYLSIVQDMANNGYHLVAAEPHQLLTSEVSYAAFNNQTIVIFVHIPIAKMHLELYEYVPLPLHPSNTSDTLMISHDKRYLAISSNRARFREMNDLLHCNKIEGVYFCPGLNILQKDAAESCLASLFKQQISKAKLACKFTQGPKHAIYEQLSATAYFISTQKTIAAQISCDGIPFGTKQLLGRMEVHIPHGCEFKSGTFLIVPEVTDVSERTLRRFELKQESVNSLALNNFTPRRLLQLWSNFPDTNHGDSNILFRNMPNLDQMMHELIDEQLQQRRAENQNSVDYGFWASTLGITSLMITIACCLCFCVYSKCGSFSHITNFSNGGNSSGEPGGGAGSRASRSRPSRRRQPSPNDNYESMEMLRENSKGRALFRTNPVDVEVNLQPSAPPLASTPRQRVTPSPPAVRRGLRGAILTPGPETGAIPKATARSNNMVVRVPPHHSDGEEPEPERYVLPRAYPRSLTNLDTTAALEEAVTSKEDDAPT